MKRVRAQSRVWYNGRETRERKVVVGHGLRGTTAFVVVEEVVRGQQR